MVLLQAPVRPRVVSPETGDFVPLDEAVAAWLEGHSRGMLEIVGGPGSGKTTALAHLAGKLLPSADTLLLDDATLDQVVTLATLRRVIYTSQVNHEKHADLSLRLTSWGDDEAIEYLLAVHREHCPSVMARVRAAGDRRMLQGVPELWRVVLDGLAGDESAADWRTILWREIERHAAATQPRRLACNYSLAVLCGDDAVDGPQARKLLEAGCDRPLLRLLRHRAVQLLLAVDELCETLGAGGESRWLGWPLPPDLVRETGAAVARVPSAVVTLDRMVESPNRRLQPAAASLLHATRLGWRPRPGGTAVLTKAHLHAAQWPGVDLTGMRLDHADLSEADLSEATLRDVYAARTCFRQVRLTGARLAAIDATAADVSGANLANARAFRAVFRAADLTEADLTAADLTLANLRDATLTSACLRGVKLREADLEGATIEGADFSGADLRLAVLARLALRVADFTGASFQEARLGECDLEQMELADANFEDADLTRAYLTGSIMPRARFRGARLRGAGLADIEWERADLRGADLRESSFYLGSTRSGLVGSPIASEGSRTGFYTDDYDLQQFKSPEEIRKANLRGADLRGANVEGVDFYLVDLRDALYSREQEEQFRRCGAILTGQRMKDEG